MKTETTTSANSKRRIKAILEMIGWSSTIAVDIYACFHMNWGIHAALKIILLVGMIIVSGLGFRSCFVELIEDVRDQKDKERKVVWEEARHVVVVGFSVIDVLMLMVLNKFMVDSESLSKLWEARVEWIVALGTAIGILGAIWAVLAKMEASRAFSEANESKDYAFRTYNSIAGAFKFNEILKQNTDFMLPFHLHREHSDLILFLGFPAVGFFHRGNHGKEDMLNEAVTFCDNLTAKLLSLKNTTEKPIIRLVLHSAVLTKEYLNKGESDKTITNKERQNYENAEKRLHEAIKEFSLAEGKNFKCAVLEKEIGLRFAISKSINPDEEENEKAIVWVVADFLINKSNSNQSNQVLSKFESAGFKSRDPEIIKALRNLCDDYIDHPREGLIKSFLSALATGANQQGATNQTPNSQEA